MTSEQTKASNPKNRLSSRARAARCRMTRQKIGTPILQGCWKKYERNGGLVRASLTEHNAHHPVEKQTANATSKPALLPPTLSPTLQRSRNISGQSVSVRISIA